MPVRRRHVALALILIAAACSSDDDGDDSAATASTITQPATAAATGTTNELATTAIAEETPDPTSTSPAIATPAPPETGVPGLESGDAFCSAWSRFGGSWQILVQANFAGDAAQAARLEVLASTLVGEAYEDVFAAWPAQLESEREVVADAYFGAFQRRSADALQSLVDAGATPDDIAQLAEAWSAALAGYDPSAMQLDVAVPPELEQLVADAATSFAERRVALPSDPSMVITADTPLTDEFLASACPDQGWIVGQDVVESP